MEPRNSRPTYPGNSQFAKKPAAELKKKNIERVTKRVARTKQKSFGEKISDMFLAVDFKEAFKRVILEVLIPDTKGTISEMLKSTVDMMFDGDIKSRRSRSGGKSPNYNYTSYNQYYGNQKNSDQQRIEQRPQSRAVVEDLVFDLKEDAEEVLENMLALLEEYEVVSVSDFYSLAGMTPEYTKDNYGWMNLDGACVMRTGRDGKWLLDLPRPTVIK